MAGVKGNAIKALPLTRGLHPPFPEPPIIW